MPDRVKPSFVSPQCQSARISKITNDGLTQNRMLYIPMATVGVKGLTAAAWKIRAEDGGTPDVAEKAERTTKN